MLRIADETSALSRLADQDSYTAETRAWLDRRFDAVDEDGVYFAHQPIYGMRAGHSERGRFDKYVRTHAILDELAHLDCTTLLDVGAAEGFKAFAARELLGIRAVACDLSAKACKRAAEIFSLRAVACDLHRLPFRDDEFDVVLCSETLEHVPDLEHSTLELLRVARKAVVITVPHEAAEQVQANVETASPHGHIQALDLDSFEFTRAHGCRLVKRRLVNPAMRLAGAILDGQRVREGTKYPGWVYRTYNRIAPLFSRAVNRTLMVQMLRIDQLACRRTNAYSAILFTLLKPGVQRREDARSVVRRDDVISLTVPLHRLVGATTLYETLGGSG